MKKDTKTVIKGTLKLFYEQGLRHGKILAYTEASNLAKSGGQAALANGFAKSAKSLMSDELEQLNELVKGIKKGIEEDVPRETSKEES